MHVIYITTTGTHSTNAKLHSLKQQNTSKHLPFSNMEKLALARQQWLQRSGL